MSATFSTTQGRRVAAIVHEALPDADVDALCDLLLEPDGRARLQRAAALVRHQDHGVVGVQRARNRVKDRLEHLIQAGGVLVDDGLNRRQLVPGEPECVGARQLAPEALLADAQLFLLQPEPVLVGEGMQQELLDLVETPFLREHERQDAEMARAGTEREDGGRSPVRARDRREQDHLAQRDPVPWGRLEQRCGQPLVGAGAHDAAFTPLRHRAGERGAADHRVGDRGRGERLRRAARAGEPLAGDLQSGERARVVADRH